MFYETMKSVQITSVEAERAFSAVGLFITKLCSRLNIKSINALCLLGSHLKLKKLRSLSRKKITINILQLEIQDGSNRFFLNGIYCYILFHVSYGHPYFLLVYFYEYNSLFHGYNIITYEFSFFQIPII